MGYALEHDIPHLFVCRCLLAVGYASEHDILRLFSRDDDAYSRVLAAVVFTSVGVDDVTLPIHVSYKLRLAPLDSLVRLAFS